MSNPRPRVAFTVLELLVVIGIVGLLIALLLPAVIAARESARRATCTSQLRQIGLAVHQHHNWRQRLPAAWQLSEGEDGFAFGWAAQLLPGLEEAELASRIGTEKPSLASADEAVGYTLAVVLCPSDLSEPTFALLESDEDESENEAAPSPLSTNDQPPLSWLPTTNYVGVYGTLEADDYYEQESSQVFGQGNGPIVFDRRVTFASLRRGQSKTLMVGERKMSLIPSTWLGVDLLGEDATCRLVGSAMTQPNCRDCDECEFTSRHVGGSNFVWADGHVEMVTDDIDPQAYRGLAKRSAD